MSDYQYPPEMNVARVQVRSTLQDRAMSDAKAPTEIERELSAVSYLVEQVACDLEDLRARIAPACRRPAPQVVSAMAPRPVDDPTQSDLGDRLAETRRRLQTISDNIRGTTQAVAL